MYEQSSASEQRQWQANMSPEQAFFQMQYGYLKIMSLGIIDKAIVLMGNTKAGKTTLLHAILQSILIGSPNNEGRIVYKSEYANEKLRDAQIGDRERESETQIPNIVEMEIDQERVSVVDLPGFLDSYGCYRTICNRFFTKIVFDQLRSVKFVIACAYSDLDRTAIGFTKTIQSFFRMFQNYQQKINQISKHVTIVITQVPPNISQQKLAKSLASIQMPTDANRKCYKILINQLQKYHRVLRFQAAVLDKLNQNLNLGHLINSSIPSWWAPKAGGGDMGEMGVARAMRITMTDAISVAGVKTFMKELEKFSNSIDEIFRTIYKGNFHDELVVKFIQEADTDKPIKFVELAQKFLKQQQDRQYKVRARLEKEVQRQKQFREQSTIISEPSQLLQQPPQQSQLEHKVKQAYCQLSEYQQKKKQESKKLYQSLMGKLQKSSSEQAPKDTQISLQKMIAFQKITQICSKVQRFDEVDSLHYYREGFQEILVAILDVFRKFTQVKSEVKIFVYCLLVKLKIIVEIHDIFKVSSMELGYFRSGNVAPIQIMYIMLEIPLKVKQLFTYSKFTSIQRSLKYINSIDLSKIPNKLKLYERYLSFINDISQNISSKSAIQLSQQGLDPTVTKQTQIHLSVQKSNLKLKIFQYKIQYDSNNSSQNRLQQLQNYRQQFVEKSNNTPNTKQGDIQRQKYLCIIIKILQLICYHANGNGRRGEKLEKWDKLVEVYQCLNDGYRVLEIYRDVEKEKEKAFDVRKQYQYQEDMLKFMVQYMYKAFKFARLQLAIQKGQKAYSIAQSVGNQAMIQKIGRFLYKICPQISLTSRDPEISKMFDQRQNYLAVLEIGITEVGVSKDTIKQLIKR